MNNGDILYKLIEEDFGIIDRGNPRWAKSEEHDSLVLDRERGIFYWNSKGIVGDPMIYLTKIRLSSFSEAREYLKQFEYEGIHIYNIKGGDRKDVIVYPKLVDVFHHSGREAGRRNYFYRRGLTDDTINRFQLGWYNGYSMIPFFENGTFRNFQMRTDQPVKRIKSYYSGIGAIMFNSDILKLVNTIYYVEGPVDAMALLQNGIPAISSNSGGGFLPEWFSKFIYQTEIYIVFDNDKAGLNEAKRLARFLGELRCKIYTFEDFEETGYDPVNYFMDNNTGEEFINLVKEKSRYVFEI